MSVFNSMARYIEAISKTDKESAIRASFQSDISKFKEVIPKMTSQQIWELESRIWVGKMERFFDKYRITWYLNDVDMVLADELVKHDLWIQEATHKWIRENFIYGWKKVSEYSAYKLASYIEDTERWIKNHFTDLKNLANSKPWYSDSALLLDEMINDLDITKSLFKGSMLANIDSIKDNAFFRFFDEWTLINDPERWTKLFNDIEELTWWPFRKIDSKDYINNVLTSFWYQPRMSWLWQKIWADSETLKRTADTVTNLNRAIFTWSRRITGFTSVAPLVTSAIWYKIDLDVADFMKLNSYSNTESIMEKFGINLTEQIRLQVGEYFTNKWITPSNTLNKIIAEALSRFSYTWKSKSEIAESFFSEIIRIVNEKGLSNDAVRSLTSIRNWRQDIADIFNVVALKKASFDLAANHFGWIDFLNYRYETLKNELDIAISKWDEVEANKIRYNIDLMNKQVNERYRMLYIYLWGIPQEYAVWWWRLFDMASSIGLWFQWWRWMSKLFHTVKYNLNYARELMSYLVKWEGKKAIEQWLLSIPNEIPMHFLGTHIQWIRYNNFLSRYLQWLDPDSDDWTVDEFYEAVDWLSRFTSFFQSIYSNPISRILLQGSRRALNMMFDDKNMVDVNGFQINTNWFEQLNYILRSISGEMLSGYRVIPELMKIQQYGAWKYIEERLFKQYNYKNMYAQYWDADVVFDTPWSILYYFLWSTNSIQDSKFDLYNTKNTAQYIANATGEENMRWFVSNFIIDWLTRGFIISKIVSWIDSALEWKKYELTEKEQEYLTNGYFAHEKYADEWNIKWIYWEIDKLWLANKTAEDVKNWVRKNLFAEIVMFSDMLDTSWQVVDDDWNIIQNIDDSQALKDQILQGYWNRLTAKSYLDSIAHQYIWEAQSFKQLFWEDNANMLIKKYWEKITDPEKFQVLVAESGKDWDFWDLLKTAGIDTSVPWGAAVFFSKMAGHNFNLLKNGDQWVVDPRNLSLKDTKQEVIRARNDAIARWDTAMVQEINNAFFTKKWAWKKNFSKHLYITESWKDLVVNSTNTERVATIQDYIIKNYMPYLKSTNQPSYWNVMVKLDHVMNYNYPWWNADKWLWLDMYETPQGKDAQANYAASPILKQQYRDYIDSEISMYKSLREWDFEWYLSKQNLIGNLKIYWPRDIGWKLIPETERTDEQRRWTEVAQLYLLDNALKEVETLPISDVLKVWAYASIVRNWWMSILQKMEWMELDWLAGAVFEHVKRSLFWWMMEIPEVIKHSIIDEASRLSWIDLLKWPSGNWWWGGWWGSWWGSWWLGSSKLKKADMNLLKDFIKTANKVTRFNDINLWNARKSKTLTFTPFEQKIIKQSRGREPAKSKSYDAWKSWWWQSIVSKSISYWRRSSRGSKKKGLKTLSFNG